VSSLMTSWALMTSLVAVVVAVAVVAAAVGAVVVAVVAAVAAAAAVAVVAVKVEVVAAAAVALPEVSCCRNRCCWNPSWPRPCRHCCCSDFRCRDLKNKCDISIYFFATLQSGKRQAQAEQVFLKNFFE